MTRRLHFHGLEVLEQESGVDTPIFDKARNLEIDGEQIKKDLDDLESKLKGADKIKYDTLILAIRNDLDHLMNKTKGLKKTYEKTADGGRGLGRRQDRMKLRTAKNVVSLAVINDKFDQLDDKIYRELGIESERQQSKHLGRTLGNTTNTIVNSGVLKVDANMNVIGYDKAILAKMDPILQKNIESGKALWEGDASAKNIVNAGAQGVIGGGMDKLGYSNKNINNVVNIAKILAGLMIIKTYWEKTDGFGEKLAWGIGLYALLSKDALGGWDMFWEGGQNKVLNINGIIDRAKGQAGVSPEVIQNKEMILKGKDRVAGLKILFNDPQKLKLYLKNDQGKWNFDNQKFLTNYGLDNLQPGMDPKAKEGFSEGDTKKEKLSIGDINDPAAKCVLLGLIGANRFGQNAQLNDAINTYLQATDLKTVDAVINASPNDLNTKATDALAKIDTEQAALIAKKQLEESQKRSELNLWLDETVGSGYVVVEGREDAVKAIKDLNLTAVETKQLLIKQELIRATTSKDIAEVRKEDLALIPALMNLRYTEKDANALVSSLVETRTIMRGFPDQNPKLVFEENSVFYQNHGRKIQIKSKSQDETMKFNLADIGLNDNYAQGTTGFTKGLLVADAICNLLTYVGRMDRSKYAQMLEEKTKSGDRFPFDWSETFKTVEIGSQSNLFSLDNVNPQINAALGKAYEIGNGGWLKGKTDHTLIQNLLTNINAAKIDGKPAWIEGEGITIPNSILASGATAEQTADLTIEYSDVQTMSDLTMLVHDKIRSGVKVLWSDVVDAVERIGGDATDLIKKAIPATAEIVELTYNKLKDGMGLVYKDGKNFVVAKIGPDTRALGKWTIETAGMWTAEAIDETFKAMAVLFKPENMTQLKNHIHEVGGLVGKTLDEAGVIIRESAKGILEGGRDVLTDPAALKFIATYLGYTFTKGLITGLVS